MSKPTELAAFTLRLSKDEHRALSTLAVAEHRSIAAEARRAIIAHLASHKDIIEEAAA